MCENHIFNYDQFFTDFKIVCVNVECIKCNLQVFVNETLTYIKSRTLCIVGKLYAFATFVNVQLNLGFGHF